MENEIKNLELYHQAEETKEIIYLFKSVEDIEKAKEKTADKDAFKAKSSLGLVKATSNTEINEIVLTLNKLYMDISLYEKHNNFTLEEIADISLATEVSLLQSWSSDSSYYSILSLIPMLINLLKEVSQYKFGEKITFNDNANGLVGKYGLQRYFFNNNKIIKVWTEEKPQGHYTYHKGYFKILTNYTFKITEIIINVGEKEQTQDMRIEVTNTDGQVQSMELLAKDKHNVSSFRKCLNQIGAFFDFMSDKDFKQILNQLYSKKNYKIIYKYNTPGLIEDKKVWLLADEVISLDDTEETEKEDETNE